jgi:hypothetical protein
VISLSDHQLQTIMTAARHLPVDRRSQFLELVAEQLKVRDVDVKDAVQKALRSLEHAAA